VQFISSSLFKASVRLPANVPNGIHVVRAYLFRDGRLRRRQGSSAQGGEDRPRTGDYPAPPTTSR
jgi:hypothetical protein